MHACYIYTVKNKGYFNNRSVAGVTSLSLNYTAFVREQCSYCIHVVKTSMTIIVWIARGQLVGGRLNARYNGSERHIRLIFGSSYSLGHLFLQ